VPDADLPALNHLRPPPAAPASQFDCERSGVERRAQIECCVGLIRPDCFGQRGADAPAAAIIKQIDRLVRRAHERNDRAERGHRKVDLQWASAGFGAFVASRGLKPFGIVKVEFGECRLALHIAPDRYLRPVVGAIAFVAGTSPDLLHLKHAHPQYEGVWIGFASIGEARRTVRLNHRARVAAGERRQREKPCKRAQAEASWARGGRHCEVLGRNRRKREVISSAKTATFG